MGPQSQMIPTCNLPTARAVHSALHRLCQQAVQQAPPLQIHASPPPSNTPPCRFCDGFTGDSPNLLVKETRRSLTTSHAPASVLLLAVSARGTTDAVPGTGTIVLVAAPDLSAPAFGGDFEGGGGMDGGGGGSFPAP